MDVIRTTEKLKKRAQTAIRGLKPPQIVVLVFAAIVLLGATLLTLPISSRDGQSSGFFTALFTATSATCVTGLTLVDTWVQWSGFGQAVILLLIQIGGLGFMTILTIFMLLLRRRIGMKERLMISQAFCLDSMEGTVRLIRHVIAGVFIMEGAGTLILTLRFWVDYPFLTSLKLGLFHSVSAFCNAGFDLLGFVQPGGSLMPYQSDVIVNVTIMLLIVLGGLGFFVWEELRQLHRTKQLSVYTRLVLSLTGLLVFGGALGFACLEWNNPDTIGSMSVGQKLMHCLFQSVTTRTAGFFTINQGRLTEASKGLSRFLMLIGGSSGSTAGGLKTVTFAIVPLTALFALRGKQCVSIFHRTISNRQIRSAFALFAMFLCLIFFGGLVLSADSGLSLSNTLFESVSALSTVGLTTGITTTLSAGAQLLLIVYMFFGRVGIMTIGFGFLLSNKPDELYHYVQTEFLIG